MPPFKFKNLLVSKLPDRGKASNDCVQEGSPCPETTHKPDDPRERVSDPARIAELKALLAHAQHHLEEERSSPLPETIAECDALQAKLEAALQELAAHR